MWVRRRHKIFHFFFRWFINLVFRIKYNFRSKKYKLNKEPHLILFNHPSNFDPIFVGATFNKPTYFIANEDLFNLGFKSKLLKYLVAPIPKKKSIRDTSAIKTAIRIVKEGGNIGVSPEGNRTYSGRINNIDMAIVKFARLLKVPIVLYTISGAFGVNPRFSKNIRKGKIEGKVEKVLSVDEIKKLNNDELLEVIINTLDVDDYLLNWEFKGNKLAEDLESVFYVCPICENMHSLKSKDNIFYCMKCNLKTTYNEDLSFSSNNKDFKFKTINDYYLWQNNYMLNYNFENLTYKDLNVDIYDADIKTKITHLLNGEFSFNKKGFKIHNEEDDIFINFNDVISVSVVFHNTLILNLENTKYHIKGNSKFNALKYLNLFTLIKNKQDNIETTYLGI